MVLAVVVLLALAVVGTATGGYIWLRGYAPLEQGSTYGGMWYRGHSEGVIVHPPGASGGVPVVFPRYAPDARFHVTVTLANGGRLPVTVVGLSKQAPGGAFVPTAMEVAPSHQFGFHWRSVNAANPVRIRPGEERTVQITYRFASGCIGGQPRHYWNERGVDVTQDRHVSIRIKYARVFDRSESFAMPFVMELVCKSSVAPLSR